MHKHKDIEHNHSHLYLGLEAVCWQGVSLEGLRWGKGLAAVAVVQLAHQLACVHAEWDGVYVGESLGWSWGLGAGKWAGQQPEKRQLWNG